MTDDVLELVEGASLLISAVGRWPSFHDAAIQQIVIDRVGPTVTIIFRMNEMVGDGDAPDFRANVTLRWHEVEKLSLSGVDVEENNWIWGLKLTREENWLDATLEEMDGTHGTIRARRLEVFDCEPVK